jgi:nucleotidyltransferase/DNA polymerase involved in DNA repair
MAAKIASDAGKPDGLIEVGEDRLFDFLWPMDVDRIPGLGRKTKVVLADIGIVTIGDLAKADADRLIKLLGKNGLYLWGLACGIDRRKVQPETVPCRSISNEITFGEDTAQTQKIEGAFLWLCDKVSRRMRRARLKAKTVTLKIRLAGFHTYTRTITLAAATNFTDTLYGQIKKLYDNSGKKKRVRLVGVKVSKFIPVDVRDFLFESRSDEKNEKLHQAIDKIREKFGDASICRAGSVKQKVERRK